MWKKSGKKLCFWPSFATTLSSNIYNSNPKTSERDTTKMRDVQFLKPFSQCFKIVRNVLLNFFHAEKFAKLHLYNFGAEIHISWKVRLFKMMFKHCDFIAFFLRPLKLKNMKEQTPLSQLLLSKNASLHGNSGINSKVLSPSSCALLPSSKLLKDGCVTLRVSDWNSQSTRLLMMLYHSVWKYVSTKYLFGTRL